MDGDKEAMPRAGLGMTLDSLGPGWSLHSGSATAAEAETAGAGSSCTSSATCV